MMAAPFCHRLVSRLAEQSIESVIRCSYYVVDQLHVRVDHGCPLEQTPAKGNAVKDELLPNQLPPDDSPPAYDDIFENPHFTSTEHKDDRASVNLDKIAYHSKPEAHPKNCECKNCRHRSHAFRKRGAVRRYDSKRLSTETGTTTVDVEPFLQSISAINSPSQDDDASPKFAEVSLETLLEASRRRGGYPWSMLSGSDRFDVLNLEATSDEGEDDQQLAEESRDEEQDHTSSHPSPQPKLENPIDHSDASSTPRWLARIAALLDDETNSDLDGSELDYCDSANSSATNPHLVRSNTPHHNKVNVAKVLHPPLHSTHQSTISPSPIAINGRSRTPNHESKQMP